MNISKMVGMNCHFIEDQGISGDIAQGTGFNLYIDLKYHLWRKNEVLLIKKGATIVGTEAIRTAGNVATDEIAGQN